MVIALYVFYLAVCTVLTVIVGVALARSGRVIIGAVLRDDRLADAVSRLVVVALYLLNFGYVALTLGAPGRSAKSGGQLGTLSVKLGEELLVLGALHLTSLIVFAQIRRRQRLADGEQAAPSPWLAPPRPRAGAGSRSS